MTPMLGIMASQISGHLVTGAFDSIATVSPTTAPSTITFSSIPGTYKHLQIRGIVRTNVGGTVDNLNMRCNSDSGSNYTYHYLTGNGASATVASGLTQTSMFPIRAPGNGGTASTFGAFVIDILDYADTNKYKTARSLSGQDQNSANGDLFFFSSLWMNTAAITNLEIGFAAGGIMNNSTFALYGIKG